MRLSVRRGRSYVTYYLQAPDSATIAAANGNWRTLELSHTTQVNLERQCFRIDDSLQRGTHITHRGLCLGLVRLPERVISDKLVRLMPCTEQYVRWRQPTPGQLLLLDQPECASETTMLGPDCDKALVFNIAFTTSPEVMRVSFLNTFRGETPLLVKKLLTDGLASYIIREQVPSE